jgi:hypothetical protein
MKHTQNMFSTFGEIFYIKSSNLFYVYISSSVFLLATLSRHAAAHYGLNFYEWVSAGCILRASPDHIAPRLQHS